MLLLNRGGLGVDAVWSDSHKDLLTCHKMIPAPLPVTGFSPLQFFREALCVSKASERLRAVREMGFCILLAFRPSFQREHSLSQT